MIPIPTPARDPVLRNLNAQLEIHLSDSSLTITRLLRLVGASRTDLHRKLKQATGMSASQYIRHHRLHRATVLLREKPEWCILQVALEAGFNSQGYFATRFKECFGVSPFDYRTEREGMARNLEHAWKKMEHV